MCFRFFGYKSLQEFDRLTIPELNLMSEALAYMQVDKQNDLHTLAFLTVAAGATKKRGNDIVPVYKKYTDFFNYEKELEKLKKESDPKKDRMYKKLSKLVNREKGGEGGE